MNQELKEKLEQMHHALINKDYDLYNELRPDVYKELEEGSFPL